MLVSVIQQLESPESMELSSLYYTAASSNIYFTQGSMFVSAMLSVRPTLSFPHCVHKPVLYICVSIPAVQ